MDWMEQVAERRIQQAIREGVFDDLPGKGRPLPPDRFASLPLGIRLAARLLDNSGYAPDEVSLLRQLGEARDRLAAAETDEERAKRRREYVDAELKCNMAMERHRRMFGDLAR